MGAKHVKLAGTTKKGFLFMKKEIWKSKFLLLATGALAVGYCSVAGAAGVSPSGTGLLTNPIVVDGNLGDWGLGAPGSGDTLGDSFWGSATQGSWVHEDFVGSGGAVGPGVGGQDFDAEALYTGIDTNGVLYVALVTGFHINGEYSNPHWYQAGDIFLDFGTNKPQTGRNGSNNPVNYSNTGHSWDLAFDLSSRTGTLGSLQSVNAIGTPDFTYSFSPDGVPGYNSGPFQATGGTNHGTADFFFNQNWGGGNRHVYEFSYQITNTDWLNSILAGGWTVHWTMSCGNDFLDAGATIPSGTTFTPNDPVVPVPAAAPMGLLGLGLVAFARRRKRAAA